MKAAGLSLALGFFVIILTHGQVSKKYLKLKANYNHQEGYIIKNDSSIVKGLIKDGYLNEAKPYSVVNFVDVHGSKEKYHPDDLKGFGYSMMSFVSDGESFYQIIYNGTKMSLYKNISVVASVGAMVPGMAPMIYSSINDELFVKRHGEKSYKWVTKTNFAREFSEYFTDCEELRTNILNKKLTHEDIRSIVRRYNHCD